MDVAFGWELDSVLPISSPFFKQKRQCCNTIVQGYSISETALLESDINNVDYLGKKKKSEETQAYYQQKTWRRMYKQRTDTADCQDSTGFTSVIPDNSHYVDLQNDRLRCLQKV